MSNLLEKYALPLPSERMKNELGSLAYKYEQANTIQQKKLVLNDLLDIYVGYFDLDYKIKLIYDRDNNSDGNFHVGMIIKEDFNKAASVLFYSSFKTYIDNIYKLKNNRVDDEVFMVSRLASLTDNRDTLTLLAKETYKEFLGGESTLDMDKINVWALVVSNEMKNTTIRNDMMRTGYEDLNYQSVKNIYRCLSSDIFSLMGKEEKTHLCMLLDMHFQYEEGDSKKYYSSKITSETTNVEALQIIFNHIKVNGDTTIAKKQNDDLLDTIMSGVTYSNENEIYKNKLSEITKENIAAIKRR